MASKTVCPFIIYDFETGGLNSDKNPVCEIGMVGIKGDTLEEIGRFEAKAVYQYNPALIYEKRAMEVHGITEEDLIETGLPIKEFVDGIIGLFDKVKQHVTGKFQKPILVGHNIQDFDNDFLIAIFQYCKKDLKKYVTGREDHFGNFQPAAIDTLHLARMKWQHDDTMLDFKLPTMVDRVGLDLDDAHRAMNDVIANKEAFVSLIGDLRSGGGSEVSINKKDRFRNHFQF